MTKSDAELQMAALKILADGLFDEEKPMPAQRMGTVLVFKGNVAPAEVDAIIKALEPVLQHVPEVHFFDPSYGSGPVWYIP